MLNSSSSFSSSMCGKERKHGRERLSTRLLTLCKEQLTDESCFPPQIYVPSMFWINILDAFYQSLVCFFVPYFVSTLCRICQIKYRSWSNTGLTVYFWRPRPYQMASHFIMHSSKRRSYSCGPILMYDCCDVCLRRWQDQMLAICRLALQSMPQLSSSSCCTKSSRVTLWSDTLTRSKLLWCVYWTCGKCLPCVIRLSWSAGSFVFLCVTHTSVHWPPTSQALRVCLCRWDIILVTFFPICKRLSNPLTPPHQCVFPWKLNIFNSQPILRRCSFHTFASFVPQFQQTQLCIDFVISMSEHMWPVVLWSPILCVVLQTWIHMLVLAFSAASYFGFVLLISLFCVTCSPPTNPLGVETLQMSQPLFYIICTLTTVMALLPRYTHTHNTPWSFTHSTLNSHFSRALSSAGCWSAPCTTP